MKKTEKEAGCGDGGEAMFTRTTFQDWTRFWKVWRAIGTGIEFFKEFCFPRKEIEGTKTRGSSVVEVVFCCVLK